jgi:hypothetical protein
MVFAKDLRHSPCIARRFGATQKESTMKRTLVYAIATAMFAIAAATNPPKAHAAVDAFLTIDGPTGEGGSSSSAYTVHSWLIDLCDALGIR